MAKVEGLDDLSKAIDALNFETRARIGEAVERSAVEAAQNIKAAAPVNDLDGHPGQLRDSVHVVHGQTPFFAQIVADAKDDKGEEYGGHVEFGHRTRDGHHIAAEPFFYPAWRLSKKKALSRIRTAINRAAKTAAKG